MRLCVLREKSALISVYIVLTFFGSTPTSTILIFMLSFVAKKMPMTRITRRSLIVFLAVILLTLGVSFTSVGQSKFVTDEANNLSRPMANRCS